MVRKGKVVCWYGGSSRLLNSTKYFLWIYCNYILINQFDQLICKLAMSFCQKQSNKDTELKLDWEIKVHIFNDL